MSILAKSLIVVAVAATVTVVSAGIYAYNEIHSDPTPIAEASTPIVTPSPSPTPSGPAPSPSESVKTIAGLGTLRTSESDQADEALQAAIADDAEVYEEDVISFMHHLTHQKVEASDKWVSIEMTPERVELLVQVIEQKGKDWKRGKQMLTIAKKWHRGYFDEIDSDHNYLWKIENGTIGEAKGILSAKEEQAFVEKTFRK